MTTAASKPRVLTDESVPASVGKMLQHHGYDVKKVGEIVPAGSADPVVCQAAVQAGRILIAVDKDMRQHAKDRGPRPGRFPNLHLIFLSCRETESADRVEAALSFIEHEHELAIAAGTRMWVDIGTSSMRTHR
ncbi:DUF5615 family PIN-like protein [Dongia sp.]|uniref:DUF5615 family PIN-like protein n=1 Tax=Dongia sp. TaxID=1977262 RepID=UPI0035B0E7EB